MNSLQLFCNYLMAYNARTNKSQLLHPSWIFLVTSDCACICTALRIACNAERCISHDNSVRLSVTQWYCTQMNEYRIMRSSQ